MSVSLFTSQTPTSGNNSDGTPGITSAITVAFADDGVVEGARLFTTTTVGGTYTAAIWQVTANDPGTGSLLASKVYAGGTPAGGAWLDILFDTPVAVTAGVAYRIGVHNSEGRYVATLGFFSAPLTNNGITAPQHNGTVGGFTVSQGVFRIDAAALGYPNSPGGGQTNYFADVLFEPSSPEETLEATLTGASALSAALLREAPLAASLTGASSLAATLAREVPLAAALTGASALTVPLVREAILAGSLLAASSLTAPLQADVRLAATLTATSNLTVPLVVPTVVPADPIATPVALELLACFTEKLNELASPPKYIQLRVGQETGPLIGPGVDECCSGLAWVRVADVYPSWDSFPQADNTWTPCGPLAYAVVLEMGIAFCMPWSDSDETFDNVDPPSTADWATAFNTQMRDQNLMRQTAACCFRPTQRRAVGAWSPLPVEGGCTGGKLTVTVSVMNPCSDC